MTEKIEITVDYETEATQNGFGQAIKNVTYTITHDGETVFSETMSERMFREAHTPVRDFHRWLSREESGKRAEVSKHRDYSFRQRWIDFFQILQLLFKKFHLKAQLLLLKFRLSMFG